jgi:glycosylphosphatidylinositol transamidase (GPIT) subunit GPI8
MQQVTVENFIRVLTGRLPPSTPSSKRLLSDERSNVLIYMTGLFSFHYSLYIEKPVK